MELTLTKQDFKKYKKDRYCKNKNCQNRGTSYRYYEVKEIDGVTVYLETDICSNCYNKVRNGN